MRQMTYGVIAAALACSYGSIAHAQEANEPPSEKPLKVRYITKGHDQGAAMRTALAEAFKAAKAKDFDAFMAVAADPYIQHSPDLPDGWKPVWDLLAKRPAGFSSKPMKWLGPGGFVDNGGMLVMFREVNRGDGTPPSKIVDVMRFDDDGKYAEHWDIRQPLSKKTVSGHSETESAMTYVEKPVTYSEETEEANKEIVASFLNLAFNQGQLEEALDRYVIETYIQHNPMIADGTAAVKEVFASGKIPKLSYDIQTLVAQNDIVVAFSKVQSPAGLSAVVDILRVRDGKLVEHWDVVQPVPAEEAMPHKNGMF